MKKNYFILAATAITMMVSCADESYLGDSSGLPQENSGGAISFSYELPAATRAEQDHATSAATLNNQFIVWGEKNEAQDAAGAVPTDGNLVFPNYIVNYGASTAYTTTSNTNDWEYVGLKFDDTNTGSYSTNVTPNTKPSEGSAPAQTIKYWDNAASSYTFTAVSAKPADISAGRVAIAKTQTGTNVYGKGYTVTLTKTTGETTTYPSLADLYFADRVNIAPGTNPVQFSFRNSLSQVRAGIYETIPGYNISSIKFYVNTSGDSPTQTVEAKVSESSAFGAVCDNSTTNDFEGYITVTYYSTGSDTNKPILTVTPNDGVKKSNLILGTNLSSISTSSLLSETANDPSWDKSDKSYTAVLPQTTSNALKLKCDYTLYNPTTKETISITGKTAEIPSQYLQWKANYKYSYIFKITDNELNPITFDAVVVTNEMGNAEYITTVSEPSITTFGVTSTGAYSTGKNEYETGSDIYATFMQGTSVLTPQLDQAAQANYVKVYSVDYKTGATNAEKAEKPITELSVANAIEHTGGIITATEITSANTSTYFNSAAAKVETVPAEDGVTTKTIDALKLTGVKAAGKYAVEIVTYEAVTGLTVDTSVVTGYYTESSGTYTKIAVDDTKAADGTTYYKQVKTYKVITVQAAS